MYITYYIHISYTYNIYIYMYIIVSDNHHWAPGRLWSVVLTWSGKKKKKNWAQCPGRGDHTPQHYSMHGSVTHSNILFIDVYLPIILPYPACHPPLFCVVGTHLVLHRSNAACFIGLLAVDPTWVEQILSLRASRVPGSWDTHTERASTRSLQSTSVKLLTDK